ncbi:MAG: hypothetical protein KDA68_23105, partial [Planctomycetaceae bacterium]|nr:hypothetical protein [Planctomycetaceae bacterium]
MESPSSNAVAESSPKKKRASIGTILIRGVLLIVLLLLAMETTSCLSYMSSMSSLSEEIGMKGIPLAEASRHVRGIPFRTEEQIGKGEKKIRKVQYQWPSLVATYRINVFVNEQDVALRAGSDEMNYVSPDISRGTVEQALVNTGKAPEKEKPKPKPGLAVPVDQRVMLGAKDFSNINVMRNRRLGSLVREFVRQGILIAARDEMGLHTCDELLGELQLVKEGQVSYPLEVDVLAVPDPQVPDGAKFAVQLTRPDPSGKEFQWISKEMPIPMQPGLEHMAEQMEILSRGSLIEGLKAAGFQPAPPPQGEPLEVPEEFVDHMDLVAQYAVLRKLHSERRLKGETLENLKGLVRAYSNLGNMIEYHWGPMSKVFKARAILYADRMLVKYGKTAETLSMRAYAWTLVGNFKLAMEDAEAARKLDNGAVPDWLKQMEAF